MGACWFVRGRLLMSLLALYVDTSQQRQQQPGAMLCVERSSLSQAWQCHDRLGAGRRCQPVSKRAGTYSLQITHRVHHRAWSQGSGGACSRSYTPVSLAGLRGRWAYMQITSLEGASMRLQPASRLQWSLAASQRQLARASPIQLCLPLCPELALAPGERICRLPAWRGR